MKENYRATRDKDNMHSFVLNAGLVSLAMGACPDLSLMRTARALGFDHGLMVLQGRGKRVSRTPATPGHPQRFFFKKNTVFLCFFLFFSPKMLFFCIPMTSNVFPRAINMFFKGS